MFLLSIFLGFILSVTVSASELSIPEEIKVLSINEAPYHVTIRRHRDNISDYDYCGGSIISSRLVLTAGSCDAIFSVDSAVIRSGSNLRDAGGSERTIKTLILHENFNFYWDEFSNDLAVLVVDPPFNIGNGSEQIIELSDRKENIEVGQSAWLTGTVKTKNGTRLDQLMSMKVTVSDYKECKDSLSGFLRDEAEDKFCATHPIKNSDVCVGNIGSALVVDNRQVGIVSANPGSCMEGPGVYTSVSYHRQWILDQIKQNP